MNIKTKLFFIVATFYFVSCRQNSKLENNISLSPDAGTSYKAGEIVPLKVSYPDGSIKAFKKDLTKTNLYYKSNENNTK
jgi:hypothetical protein